MLQKNIATKIDVEETVQEAIEKLQEEIKSSHNDIIEKLDEISGDIKTFQEEHTVLTMHSSENYDKLEDHEKRINKIETVLQA